MYYLPMPRDLFQTRVVLQSAINSGFFEPLEEIYVVASWNGIEHVEISFRIALGDEDFEAFIKRLRKKVSHCIVSSDVPSLLIEPLVWRHPRRS